MAIDESGPIVSAAIQRAINEIQENEIRQLRALAMAALIARKSKVFCRSGYYDVSQFDEVFSEFDRLSHECQL